VVQIKCGSNLETSDTHERNNMPVQSRYAAYGPFPLKCPHCDSTEIFMFRVRDVTVTIGRDGTITGLIDLIESNGQRVVSRAPHTHATLARHIHTCTRTETLHTHLVCITNQLSTLTSLALHACILIQT
jgi:hypothetical protein